MECFVGDCVLYARLVAKGCFLGSYVFVEQIYILMRNVHKVEFHWSLVCSLCEPFQWLL